MELLIVAGSFTIALAVGVFAAERWSLYLEGATFTERSALGVGQAAGLIAASTVAVASHVVVPQPLRLFPGFLTWLIVIACAGAATTAIATRIVDARKRWPHKYRVAARHLVFLVCPLLVAWCAILLVARWGS